MSGPRAWRALLREPLLHFTVLGTSIFLLYAGLAPSERNTIAVTPEIVEVLVDEREATLGRPLSTEERAAVVEGFIGEEILLREARRLGLDRRDGKIRHRLIDKMRFLYDTGAEEPAAEALASFYEANPSLYRIAESITFEHVFFSPGQEPTDPPGLLAELRGGVDFTRLGQPFWLGAKLERFAEQDLAQVMGKPFASTLFGLELAEWSGPHASTRGLHFVRVLELHPARMPPFEAVQRRVREDWEKKRRQELQARKLEELRRRYSIQLEGFEA